MLCRASLEFVQPAATRDACDRMVRCLCACSANLVAPPAVSPDDWTVGLQGVGSSVAGQLPLTSTLCSVSTPCTVLVDTGNPGISVPNLAFLEIAAAIGAIIDQVSNLMLLPSCATLPTLPTFTFRIADHEYSVGPNDYIRQVRHPA